MIRAGSDNKFGAGPAE